MSTHRHAHELTLRNALLLGMLAATASLSACGGDDSAGRNAGLDAGTDAGGGSSCTAGELGCVCRVGSCGSVECVANECVDCMRGEFGCVCMSNGACANGARCEGELCVDCEAGTEGCPCDGSGECKGELACLNDVCAPATCEEGTLGCPCRADSEDPRCTSTLYCDDNAMCRACATDVAGCPCDEDGMCTGRLVCEADLCRPRRDCQDLVDAGECAEHQLCEPSDDADATCVAAQCEEGYVWDAGAAQCRQCVSADCSAEPTCDPGGVASIAAECAAQFETCVEDSAGARCEGCVAGAVLTGDRCIPILDCGGAPCADDEYCDTDTQQCKELPCPAGQAADSTGDCSPCPLDCDAVGLSGRVWPFRTNGDTCICETVLGYYMPSDQRAAPAQCDADQDRWVREEADDNSVRGDDALRLNSRCDILTVDGVLLRDEFGTDMEVGSCGDGEGLVLDPEGAGAGACTSRKPLRLLETERNDVPGRPRGVEAPVYDHLDTAGSGGRLLEARELNSLTKACVTAIADYNDNGKNDLTEEQTRPAMIDDDDRRRLESFAYFTELYRSWYQAPSSGPHGKLVIAERSRCDLEAFYLTYMDGSAYSAADPYVDPETVSDETPTQAGSNYWRNCERRRDPTFDTTGSGFDFAQWSCPATADSCLSAPPAHATEDATMFTFETKLLRDHGVCEADGERPGDGRWRGMGHHSQFKCVQIDNSVGVQPPKYAATTFQTGGTMTLNVCEATAGSRPTHGGAASYEPIITCTPHDPSNSVDANIRVAWAAVSFRSYTDATVLDGSTGGYVGGCIDEDTEWGNTWLCHYPEFNQDNDDAASYGRYSCYAESQNFLWAFSAEDTSMEGLQSTLFWDGPNSKAALSVWR